MQILYINNKCSNNCYHCDKYNHGIRNTENTKNIELQIKSLDNTKPILIKGCDPIESNDFFSILDLLKQKQCKKIQIITSGKKFSELEFCKEFAEYSDIVQVIIFKILGPEPEIHDSLTRTIGSFEQTYQGIINLINMKINIGIIFTILEQNFMYMEQTVDKFTQLGIKNIILEYPRQTEHNKQYYDKIVISLDKIKTKVHNTLKSHPFPVLTLNIPDKILENHKDHSIDNM